MMNRIRTPLSLGLIGTFLFFVPPRGETENFLYRVAPGDTLYSIARQYGVGVAALQDINKITDPSRLFVGQSLVIPRAYTVKPGDTLFGIARNYNLSLSELLALNNRVENQVLRVGEVLIVGDEVTNSGQSPTVLAPSPDPAPTTNPTTTTVTLNTQTTVAITPPRTAGTMLTSQLSTDGSGTTWPIEGERYEFSGKFPGIAILADQGTLVRSVTSGRVIYSGPHSTLGQVVFVQHPRGYVYIYGGNESLQVQTGDEVTPGTELGSLGLTPAVQRSQLFFSVWKDGGYLDPRLTPR